VVLNKFRADFVSIDLGDFGCGKCDDPEIKHHMVIGAYDDDVSCDVGASVASAQWFDVVRLGIPPFARQ